MQYSRCGRFFVLMATKGDHPFKGAERDQFRDVRRVAHQFAGYRISYRPGGRTRQGEPDPKWHAHVKIERVQYRLLRDYFLERVVHRGAETLASCVPPDRIRAVHPYPQAFTVNTAADESEARPAWA